MRHLREKAAKIFRRHGNRGRELLQGNGGTVVFFNKFHNLFEPVSYTHLYPDYKFPMTIYSDEYLPKKGELSHAFANYDRERVYLFDEPRVYDSLIESGLFPEFSNSFLVIVQQEGK